MNDYYDTLLGLTREPSLIAAAAQAKYGLPERRCRWWVRRHKWIGHRVYEDTDGTVTCQATYCKRCKADRILMRGPVSGVGQ